MTSDPSPNASLAPTGTAASIVIAGALIALSIYTSGGRSAPVNDNQVVANAEEAPPVAAQREPGPSIGNIRPIAVSDHIRGPADARITIVEYSDTECPFCKQFQTTMQQIIAAYPKDVRWVYRHAPLDQLHSKARQEAEATECANELGGHKIFWSYLDKLFETTPSNDGLDPASLPLIAEQVGLNKEKFSACLDSGKFANKVEDDFTDSQTAGMQGTPYSILITANGQKQAISGAQPLSALKQAIDKSLAE